MSKFLIDNALTEGSRAAYEKTKLFFQCFVQEYFPGSDAFPLCADKLVLFVAFCYSKQLAPQTVISYMSALAHFNKMKGYEDTTSSFIVQRALQGYKKLKGKSDIRLPITPVILRQLVQSLSSCCSSFYKKQLYKAMYLLAFHAFLRVGEITSNMNSKPCLSFSSIEFELMTNREPIGMKLTLKEFKHHRGKDPIIFHLSSSQSDSDLCPVKAMWDYCSVRGSLDGPLFVFSDLHPVSRQSFSNQLKICLIFLKYDTKLYKTHSFRIGAASWAKAKGVSDDQIQLMGRWKSDAYRKYIRIPLLNL